MLREVNLEKLLVLDIETVPMTANYNSLPEAFKKLWDDKCNYLRPVGGMETPEQLFQRAGIYAEFGKVLCISFGIFKKHESPTGSWQFRVKSFCGDDERRVLLHFIDLLNNHFCRPGHYLCAHNGKEFDFPFLARRMLVHGFELPDFLDLAGKKPWETEHLVDTLHLWRFGDYKSYTSLNLLTALFGIPTPKDDITGADVFRVYYEEKGLDRIRAYCQKDVIATARLLMKFKGLPMLHDEDVIEIEPENHSE